MPGHECGGNFDVDWGEGTVTPRGCYAWFADNSDDKTHPVGKKKPNAWGIYDMHGKVWEWCQDWYGRYPSGAVTAPTGPQSGSLGVFRGGGWNLEATVCRSANRFGFFQSYRIDYVGFRVTCIPSGQ